MTIETTGELVARKLPGALPHDLGGPAEDPLGRANLYCFRNPNVRKDLNPKFVLQLARDRGLDVGGAAMLRDRSRDAARSWPRRSRGRRPRPPAAALR